MSKGNRRKRKINSQKHNQNSNSFDEQNNPSPVNFEIDYEKLAEAIVKANRTTTSTEFKYSKRRIKIMNFCNGAIYLMGFAYGVTKIFDMWSNNEFGLRDKLFFSVILITTSLVCFLMQQESLSETKEETAFHFNSNIVFLTLIVALVALLKV